MTAPLTDAQLSSGNLTYPDVCVSCQDAGALVSTCVYEPIELNFVTTKWLSYKYRCQQGHEWIRSWTAKYKER